MTKRAIPALLIAILLPLLGYYSVKFLSKDSIHMPKRYFYDDVREISDNGKRISDTVWHKIKNVPFTNQLGKQVTFDHAHGKILVVDFFFTSCPSICPGMARNMKRLQQSFAKNDSVVQFISISIDPERDSVPRLREFADRFNANHDNWWFVTGDKKEIYSLALDDFKANVADVGADTAFPHTENFFLVDTNRVVRGWYNGFDTTKLAQLASAIPTLRLERDRNKPSFLRAFIPALPAIFVAIGLIILVSVWLGRSKNKNYGNPVS